MGGSEIPKGRKWTLSLLKWSIFLCHVLLLRYITLTESPKQNGQQMLDKSI